LSPSEKVWSKRCEFLFQKGYQLRPRYQPKWNATFRGNGTHPTSAEDHIMQIVSVCHSSFYYVGKSPDSFRESSMQFVVRMALWSVSS
jgi:hypothetical protein